MDEQIQLYSVIVKLGDNNEIVAINSSAFLSDTKVLTFVYLA